MLRELWVIVIWAMLVGWIAKVAQARGRSVIGWALGAAVIGAFGFALGLVVVGRVVDAEIALGLTLLSMLTPLVLMIGSMVALAIVLYRKPVHVALRKDWPVHFVNRGPGRLRLHGGNVSFEWEDGARELALRQLQRVEADGECVRVGYGDGDELAFLPTGKPDTPAGRRQQSTQLARLLRPS